MGRKRIDWPTFMLKAFIISLLAVNSLKAQLQLDTTRSIRELVQNELLGDGVVVGNIYFKGAHHAIGSFKNGESSVGISNGLILSTGNVLMVQGPNNAQRSGWASQEPGDPQLDNIARGKTQDAVVLEFDFVTTSEYLVFNFVFASEEYLEYVGSQYNDVFAFFINGPGLNNLNIARLPIDQSPITVNSVNHEFHPEYFVNNHYSNTQDAFIWDVKLKKVIPNPDFQKAEMSPPYNIQFDGFTRVIEARCPVTPNEIYHIKIAIADVADGILDSGVFLEGGSFRSTGQSFVSIKNPFISPPQPIRHLSLSPVSFKPDVKEHLDLLQIKNVEFPFDSYQFTDSSIQVVEQVYNIMVANPKYVVEIKGHTDALGSDDYNLNLSQRRAIAVGKALVDKGIDPDRIKIFYVGEQVPIASNQVPVGRMRNRRVEFSFRFIPEVSPQ